MPAVTSIEAAKEAPCEVCDKLGGEHTFGEAVTCWMKWRQPDA